MVRGFEVSSLRVGSGFWVQGWTKPKATNSGLSQEALSPSVVAWRLHMVPYLLYRDFGVWALRFYRRTLNPKP